ncbi:hypothetical protein LR013_04415 [candidate division NPL-UPA2 bacterium]|nr:hypothetical protein [candidate division NPL-UPA2 bacterium]
MNIEITEGLFNKWQHCNREAENEICTALFCYGAGEDKRREGGMFLKIAAKIFYNSEDKEFLAAKAFDEAFGHFRNRVKKNNSFWKGEEEFYSFFRTRIKRDAQRIRRDEDNKKYKHRFNIPTKFEDELNREEISEKLKKLFEENKAYLSWEKASVRTIGRARWIMDDGKSIYKIERGKKDLKIAQKIPEPVSIDRSIQGEDGQEMSLHETLKEPSILPSSFLEKEGEKPEEKILREFIDSGSLPPEEEKTAEALWEVYHESPHELPQRELWKKVQEKLGISDNALYTRKFRLKEKFEEFKRKKTRERDV